MRTPLFLPLSMAVLNVAACMIPQSCYALGGPVQMASGHTASAARRSVEPTVRGLIVQLHDAPSHERLALLREQALKAPAGLGSASASSKRAVQQQAWVQAHQQRLQGLMTVAQSLGARDSRPVGRSSYLVNWPLPLSYSAAEKIAEQLRKRPDVASVTLNERERPLQALPQPNDTFFAADPAIGETGQWWLFPASGGNASALIDRLRGVPSLQTAWKTSTGSASATVAVLDTGITCHPDLGNDNASCIGGKILPGHDFVAEVDYANDGDGRDNDARDPGDGVNAEDIASSALFNGCSETSSSWHGTIIAGVMAASSNNRQGVAGVSWNGRILPVRVAGKCGAEVADIIDGMRWAAGLAVADGRGGFLRNPNPVRIVNISFGSSAVCTPAYQQAVDELHDKGVVVVAAAGNEHGEVIRPASCQGVVGVAALNRDGFKASYSNFGEQLTVSTVGGDSTLVGRWGGLLGDDGLLTLSNSGDSSPLQAIVDRVYGTSFSAPITAGVVSLMLSVNPGLSVDQIIQGLRASARPHGGSSVMQPCSWDNPGRCACTVSTCGAGVLDAPQALAFARNPTAYVAPAWPAVSYDNAQLREAAAQSKSDLDANPPPPDEGGGALDGWALWGLLGLVMASLAKSLLRRPKQA
jgi:serine protease